MARLIEHDRDFIAQLKRHEGLRLEAYYCPAGYLTIGWGHNLEANPVKGIEEEGQSISMAQAMALLEEDVHRITRQLDKRLPWWRKMDNARQGVVATMAFQMGTEGLCGFARALAAMEQQNFLRAAAEMLDSKWAEKDSPNRAWELARQMQTGEWQKEQSAPKGARK